ncbi:hypothetical protein [Salarchaeum japonicum]|uniref:Uncharacterized protein n=1 Tax=Salarchaeum japonicum TaxID=555573 RepID=A0AAV3T0H9_9EURY|nr:hypothetical protein [Salarchaeum japonicum]
MQVVPEPGANDAPVHETETVTLEPGQKATITMSPSTSGNLHYLPVVAISKHSLATYKIEVDGTLRFGEAGVPPTDPDDLDTTFLPALQLQRTLKMTVKDVRADGAPRRFIVQVIGWEA